MRDFWGYSSEQVVELLQARYDGLTVEEARSRLVQYGPNRIRDRARTDTIALLLRQVKSPVVLILVFAAILAIFLRDAVDSGIILTIIGISALLGFWQERGASQAVERLLALV